MQKQDPAIVFDEERAASYDDTFAKIAPMRDALHLLTRFVPSELAPDARIYVDAGTGVEIIYLAESFPQWRFTAVQPAAAMLAVCRRPAAKRRRRDHRLRWFRRADVVSADASHSRMVCAADLVDGTITVLT